MSLIYVTGVAGSGKSAVQSELERLGYPAFDVDQPEIGAAHNNKSNQIVAVPDANHRTQEWFAAHSWRILRQPVEKLKHEYENSVVFLCGTAGNEKDMSDLFDKVLLLDIDEVTLRQRIASREDNDYGKSEHELQQILGKQRAMKQNQGSVKVIDATRPLTKVVADILAEARQ
jgi:dephospho-CoA kinase